MWEEDANNKIQSSLLQLLYTMIPSFVTKSPSKCQKQNNITRLLGLTAGCS
jgi:hypothetical protein